MRRTDQRRAAAFAVYQEEVTSRPLEDLLDGAKPFTRELATGASNHRGELDAMIADRARGWTLERIAPLEKAIMRVALYEIHHRDDVPTPVAIDEAVSLARRYCGSEAPSFVNGILSAASADDPASAANGEGAAAEPTREARA